MTIVELITVGLSESANEKLDALKELGYFAEKIDGYRFAVSLALAQGVIPPEISKRTTFVNVGSLDPDQLFRSAVEALMPDHLSETTAYRLIERLADWGVNDLYAQSQTSGAIDFARLLEHTGSEG